MFFFQTVACLEIGVGAFLILLTWDIVVPNATDGQDLAHHRSMTPPPRRVHKSHSMLTSHQANSISSFVSDISWAYAMLLTTPLVVTVGLSLTIPLSLIGEMITYAQYSSAMYWVGAAVVVLSFLFINNESKAEGAAPGGGGEASEESRGAIV